ncbi:GntR family transcriptional regulator (plasmid) [Agrobacterium leguminum]|uniref:Transcriptional regulator, GntR family n=1 Tax=Agrobacterium deltaense NCPPB 1641 TaxID=1183425 RepID=A0A1S7U9F0_9HYPH|nr:MULTISPECIES: GntR family transcriptional regulator [Agrobacterium]WFS70079.1 GntR family transcriptional regulator [Agrobacterium leguminum]CVI63449.1 Transcriptional regulator, GntR family [Agrobacterium deltaense NCPPB 1641]
MNSSLKAQTELLKRPASLGNEVYEALYAQLMSLKIPPGSRISVDSLVRSLGVSQTPIREALSRLEALGLVEKTHLVGYSAAQQLNRDRLEQLYELRLLLEPFAAGKLAERRDEVVIAELKSLDLQMRNESKVTSRAAYGEFAKKDAAFHNHIARSCGNDLVFESLQRLHTHVHLFRLYFHARATTDAIKEHEDLIQAIEEGNVPRAEKAMRRHIERSKSRFIDAFDEP